MPLAAAVSGGYLTPGPTGGGIRPGTGQRAATARTLGVKAAKLAGKPAKLPVKTVGIINFLNGIESSDRLDDTVRYVAAQLGWKSITCDGKGTPSVFVACGNSLLTQHVQAIYDVAIAPDQIASVMTAAAAAHVPVVQVGGGGVPNGTLAGNYGPNEPKAGTVLTTWLLKKLSAVSGTDKIAVQNFPAAWASLRTAQLTKAVAAQSHVQIVSNLETDAANIVPFTKTATSTVLTANPDLKAYWFTFDTTGQVGGTVVAAQFPGKSFPARPLVVTFHADQSTLALMRTGSIDATSEVNYDASVWEATDGLAEFFTRHKSLKKANQPTYPGIGDPFTYSVVTSANLPPVGQYVPPKYDVPSYFLAKWKAEFGK